MYWKDRPPKKLSSVETNPTLAQMIFKLLGGGYHISMIEQAGLYTVTATRGMTKITVTHENLFTCMSHCLAETIL